MGRAKSEDRAKRSPDVSEFMSQTARHPTPEETMNYIVAMLREIEAMAVGLGDDHLQFYLRCARAVALARDEASTVRDVGADRTD